MIGAENLLVENCLFSNTSGTGPSAGIDFEPNHPEERLVNCIVRNCITENNDGCGFEAYLRQLSRQSEPVSILFENCLCRGGQSAAMVVGAVKDDGPEGLVEFRNCTAENTGKEGTRVFDKSSDHLLVRFTNCNWNNPWSGAAPSDTPQAPILIQLRRPELTQRYGGVEFVDCTLYDTVDRPAVLAQSKDPALPVRNLTGQLTVHNPHGARMDLGPNPEDIDLQLIPPAAPQP